MNITINRHEEYNKYIISIDKNFSTDRIVIYDISIKELAQFINEIIKNDEE